MSFRESSAPRSAADAPLTRERLIEYFHENRKPSEKWLVGAEFEKLLIDPKTGAQISPKAATGSPAILAKLADAFGWQAHEDDGTLIALTRQETLSNGQRRTTSVTLEPGGQIELATPPCTDLKCIENSLLKHRRELEAVIDPQSQRIIAAGLTPFSEIPSLEMTGRRRHNIMHDYLPKKGKLASHMMKGTASVQVAVDYASDADAALKFFVALGISPLQTALFANSPMHAGQNSGLASFRGKIWRHTDNERSGLLTDVITQPENCFERWTDHMLKQPMLFYAINDNWEAAHGRTFQDWMEKGHDGVFPNMEDWELHLTGVFTEVRMKNFIEVRGADAVPPELALTMPALCKGIFYDAEALDQALQLVKSMGHENRDILFDKAFTDGLSAEFKGRKLGAWVGDLLDIAKGGLERLHPDEAAYLDPAFELVENGASMGERLRAYLQREGNPSMEKILEYLAY